LHHGHFWEGRLCKVGTITDQVPIPWVHLLLAIISICHSPFVGLFVLCACSAALGLFNLEGSAFLFCLLL